MDIPKSLGQTAASGQNSRKPTREIVADARNVYADYDIRSEVLESAEEQV